MSNKKLVNLDYLDREAQLFKQARTNIEENTKIVREAIDKNTKEEVESVQTAIQNLNKKVQRILDTDFVKEKKKYNRKIRRTNDKV